MLQALIDVRAQIEARDAFRQTVVMIAAKDFPEAVGPLLVARADADAVNGANMNPLGVLAMSPSAPAVMSECVELLLAAKADINGSQGRVTESCRWRTIQYVARGLVFCGNTSKVLQCEALASRRGVPPLLWSIFLNNPTHAGALVGAGANPHTKLAGRTLLEYVRRCRHSEEVWQHVLYDMSPQRESSRPKQVLQSSTYLSEQSENFHVAVAHAEMPKLLDAFSEPSEACAERPEAMRLPGAVVDDALDEAARQGDDGGVPVRSSLTID